MARPANTDLVAIAWLKDALDITSGVGTKLPDDNTTWAASGFIRVGPVVGGGVDLYAPQNSPVIQVEFYGANSDSKQPAWDKASDLAMRTQEATYDMAALGARLTLRSGYRQAYVQSAGFVAPPRRVEGDPTGYAVLRGDLQLTWIEVPE